MIDNFIVINRGSIGNGYLIPVPRWWIAKSVQRTDVRKTLAITVYLTLTYEHFRARKDKRLLCTFL